MVLNVDDVCALDRGRVSDTTAFRMFAEGIHLDSRVLTNERWAHLPELRDIKDVCGIVMHEVVPLCFDTAVLEKQGGHLSVRITGAGDFTLVGMNRRVVVLQGLPQDTATGQDVIDLEIDADVFLSFCRGLVFDAAGHLLTEDDEGEDREISNLELTFNGMPSGGAGGSQLLSQSSMTSADAAPTSGLEYFQNGDEGQEVTSAEGLEPRIMLTSYLPGESADYADASGSGADQAGWAGSEDGASTYDLAVQSSDFSAEDGLSDDGIMTIMSVDDGGSNPVDDNGVALDPEIYTTTVADPAPDGEFEITSVAGDSDDVNGSSAVLNPEIPEAIAGDSGSVTVADAPDNSVGTADVNAVPDAQPSTAVVDDGAAVEVSDGSSSLPGDGVAEPASPVSVEDVSDVDGGADLADGSAEIPVDTSGEAVVDALPVAPVGEVPVNGGDHAQAGGDHAVTAGAGNAVNEPGTGADGVAEPVLPVEETPATEPDAVVNAGNGNEQPVTGGDPAVTPPAQGGQTGNNTNVINPVETANGSSSGTSNPVTPAGGNGVNAGYTGSSSGGSQAGSGETGSECTCTCGKDLREFFSMMFQGHGGSASNSGWNCG
ncbi:MAG: hypothetical protein KF874_13240 [Rhizobiaceae bacterium]|nr:hypothetical protein [Rhizobiaceae bacterium]